METIAEMQKKFGTSVIIGAGTVTNVREVSELSNLGCQMIVSPNTDTEVIKATKNKGMLSLLVPSHHLNVFQQSIQQQMA